MNFAGSRAFRAAYRFVKADKRLEALQSHRAAMNAMGDDITRLRRALSRNANRVDFAVFTYALREFDRGQAELIAVMTNPKRRITRESIERMEQLTLADIVSWAQEVEESNAVLDAEIEERALQDISTSENTSYGRNWGFTTVSYRANGEPMKENQ